MNEQDFLNAYMEKQLGLNLPDLSGVLIDIKNAKVMERNDGNPRMVFKDGNRMAVKSGGRGAQFPIEGGSYGQTRVLDIPAAGVDDMARILYGGPTKYDYLPPYTNYNDEYMRDVAYDKAMQSNFTP